jgi:hypothetical protein
VSKATDRICEVVDGLNVDFSDVEPVSDVVGITIREHIRVLRRRGEPADRAARLVAAATYTQLEILLKALEEEGDAA